MLLFIFLIQRGIFAENLHFQGLSSSIMVYFGVKGYRSMNKLISQTTCSLKFKSVQQQLFHALVFQTLIPVFLMHIPASAIYITIFFGKSSEIVGQTLSLTIAMYPALNPLPTIFIVKNYRKAVKGEWNPLIDFFRKLSIFVKFIVFFCFLDFQKL